MVRLATEKWLGATSIEISNHQENIVRRHEMRHRGDVNK